MWYCKLLYLVLLAGLVIFCVLYIDSLAILIFLCALIFPVFLKIGLLWLKCTCSVSLDCPEHTCHVYESIPVTVNIRNRCPFFFPKAEITVKIRHALSNTPEQTELKFPLHGKNTTFLKFYISPDYCGAIQLQLKKARAFDVLRLFHAKLHIESEIQEILVLPRKMTFALQETAEEVYAPESSHYANRPGDDPSEIFNIREYHPGDAVSRIHWKLSSKSEKLFIREFGFPIEKHILLIAEYLPETAETPIASMKKAQAFLTLIYSLSSQLAKHDHNCILAWHNGETLCYRKLKSEEQLPELFRTLYPALTSMTMDSQDLREILSGQAYSSVTCITNDETAGLLSVLEHQADAQQKNFLILTENLSEQHSDHVTVRTIPPEHLLTAVSGLKV